MLLGIPRSARCVQRFDDSLNSAIHITYRISLRSSSMPEPRDPLLKVLTYLVIDSEFMYETEFSGPPAGGSSPDGSRPASPAEATEGNVHMGLGVL